MPKTCLVIENDVVRNAIVLADNDDPADFGAVDASTLPEGVGVEWSLVDGEWVPPAPAVPQPGDLPALFETARQLVNTHVDTVARAKGYNDAAACASYLASTNPTWSAEATAFIAWRDAVWAHVFALRDQALAGEIETLPGGDELIAGLPAMSWPA